MSVALYLDPLPAPYPIRGTRACQGCADYAGRCADCYGTKQERTEDWGPCMSGSFTAHTMGAALERLGLSADGFAFAALCQALEVHWENGTPVDREIRRWVAEAREVVTPETAVYMA